jgi:hypothetical protein
MVVKNIIASGVEMREERKLEFMGTDYFPKVKEICFALGITLGSMAVGYAFVSGKWKSSLNFYSIIDSQLVPKTN